MSHSQAEIVTVPFVDDATEASTHSAPLPKPLAGVLETWCGDHIVCHESYDEVRHALAAGLLDRQTPARLVARDTVDASGVEWFPLQNLVDTDPELRGLYRPIWHHAMCGALYFGIGGAVLKLLDTTLLFFVVDDRLGFLWLLVLGTIVASRWWPWLPFIGGIQLARVAPGTNLYITGLGSAAVGALLAAPLGMAVGAAVGYARRGSLPRAADAVDEPSSTLWLALVAPLAGFVASVLAYVMVVLPYCEQLLGVE